MTQSNYFLHQKINARVIKLSIEGSFLSYSFNACNGNLTQLNRFCASLSREVLNIK